MEQGRGDGCFLWIGRTEGITMRGDVVFPNARLCACCAGVAVLCRGVSAPSITQVPHATWWTSVRQYVSRVRSRVFRCPSRSISLGDHLGIYSACARLRHSLQKVLHRLDKGAPVLLHVSAPLRKGACRRRCNSRLLPGELQHRCKPSKPTYLSLQPCPCARNPFLDVGGRVYPPVQPVLSLVQRDTAFIVCYIYPFA